MLYPYKRQRQSARHIFGMEITIQTLICTVMVCTTVARTSRQYTSGVSGHVSSRAEGLWTTWSHWTPCSMSCDQGTRSRYRGCVGKMSAGRRRLDPSKCEGNPKRYELCETEACNDQDYTTPRDYQCAQHNTDLINNKTYMWIPFQSDSTSCDLSCIAVGFAFFDNFGHVTDGTPCSDRKSSDVVTESRVCISGQCRVVGCDGTVESGTRPDKCQVCGGENRDCFLYRNSFLTLDPPTQVYEEYQEIVRIPEGATYVEVTDISANYLALMDGDTYILNGHWMIDWPGTFDVSGTKIKYERSGTAEILTIEGPTTRNLTLMLLFKDRNPGVHFEFYLHPLKANQIVIPENEKGKTRQPPYIPPPLLPPKYGTVKPNPLPSARTNSGGRLTPFVPIVPKPDQHGMEIPLAKPLVPEGQQLPVEPAITKRPAVVHDELPRSQTQDVLPLQRDPNSYDSPFLLALESDNYDNLNPNGIPLSFGNGQNNPGAPEPGSVGTYNSGNPRPTWNNNYNYALYGPPPQLPANSGHLAPPHGDPSGQNSQTFNWDQYYQNYLARGPPPAIPGQTAAFTGPQVQTPPQGGGIVLGSIVYNVHTGEFTKVSPDGEMSPATNADIQNPNLGLIKHDRATGGYGMSNNHFPAPGNSRLSQQPTPNQQPVGGMYGSTNGALPLYNPAAPLPLQHTEGNNFNQGLPNPSLGLPLHRANGQRERQGTITKQYGPVVVPIPNEGPTHGSQHGTAPANADLYTSYKLPTSNDRSTSQLLVKPSRSNSGPPVLRPLQPYIPKKLVPTWPAYNQDTSTPAPNRHTAGKQTTPNRPTITKKIVIHAMPVPAGHVMTDASGAPVVPSEHAATSKSPSSPGVAGRSGTYQYYDADYVVNSRRRSYLDYYKASESRTSGYSQQTSVPSDPYAQNYQEGNPPSAVRAEGTEGKDEILDWTGAVDNSEYMPVSVPDYEDAVDNSVDNNQRPVIHLPVADLEGFGEEEVFDYINEIIANINAERKEESAGGYSRMNELPTFGNKVSHHQTTSPPVPVETSTSVDRTVTNATGTVCPKCHKVKNMKAHFCKSQLVSRVTVKSSRIVDGVVRYTATLEEVFRQKGLLNYDPDYIWTTDKCRCPKLKRNVDYLVMGNIAPDGKFQISRRDYTRAFKSKFYSYITKIVKACPDLNFLH